MSAIWSGIPVAELGDGFGIYAFDELSEAPRSFWYCNAEKRFFVLTKCSAFGDEAKSVEVHVRAGSHSYEGSVLISRWMLCNVFLQASDSQCTSRLNDTTRVLKHVLDCGTRLVG